jgi:hypothetical protein
MTLQGFRKRVAKPRAPDIKSMSERPQRVADAARRRGFLVQDDQNRQQRWGGRRRHSRSHPAAKCRMASPLILPDWNDIEISLFSGLSSQNLG